MRTPSATSNNGLPRPWGTTEAPSRARVILLGACHGDPRGYRRTAEILQALNPDVVAVEVSPFALWFRRHHRRFLMDRLRRSIAVASRRLGIPPAQAYGHPRVRRLFIQIAPPYEWRAARAHRAAFGTPCYPVDSSTFSRALISHWPELLSPDNVTVLLSLPSDETPSADAEYRRAAWTLSMGRSLPFSPPASHAAPLFEEREPHLETQVRAILRALKPARLVYLGGWEHLLPGASSPSLAQRLRDLQPTRLLLDGTVAGAVDE
ncbi:hypothetical protein SAMN02745206_01755 [Desulfacinum infernum DSM 9756]|uniref:Uncharacterized protein n=1 Tax=Desulfacinum infernum DSM 9756 TaxID=1121391 RepID=A0A1M5AQQ8_9BACT|nr:hypothetical protein SAMN02745206_01755 [Desulfacinum infernum DSM 9756]